MAISSVPAATTTGAAPARSIMMFGSDGAMSQVGHDDIRFGRQPSSAISHFTLHLT